MANIVISNNGQNGSPEIPEDIENGIEGVAAVPADPSIKVTDADGNEIILTAGQSRGLAHGTYTIEVL